jgi:predicted MPP superfamily phosphohydrolase
MEVDWLNLFIILALTAGHAALFIAILNRLHARPWPRPLLHHLRQLHDALIVALPVYFVWRFGFSEPRLVYGGSWHLLPTPVLTYLAVCGTVALALPAAAICRWQMRPPHCQISNHSQRIDISRRLGFRPVGPGPYQLMTRLPANECFQIDVSDKEYRLPRLPAAWDGLSILHVSDLHLIGTIDRPYFEQVVEIANTMPSDLVVFTGDLLDREERIDWLPETLGRLKAPLGCWFVLGNHDWYLTNTAEVRQRMESLGWRDIAGRCEQISYRGETLAVCGSEFPWMGGQPDLSTVPPEAFRLLLSHTPDNLRWAQRERIDLMLAGHNHGGQIRLPGFGPVYVPSASGGRFAAGAFFEPPTLLYVSRGISGHHPLRWNCPPELTRLVLRAGDTKR